MTFNSMLLYHYMTKALTKANLVFPTTKQEAQKAFDKQELVVDEKNTKVLIADVIANFESEAFENAEAFMSAFTGYLYEPTWKQFQEKFLKK